MGSHNLPKISRKRSESENFRIKAYLVETDAVRALKSDLSPHQPYQTPRTGGTKELPGHIRDLPNGTDVGGPRRFKVERPEQGRFPAVVCSAGAPGRKEKAHVGGTSMSSSLQPESHKETSAGRNLLRYCFNCAIFPTYKTEHKLHLILTQYDRNYYPT